MNHGRISSCRTTSTRYAIGTAANRPSARPHGFRSRGAPDVPLGSGTTSHVTTEPATRTIATYATRNGSRRSPPGKLAPRSSATSYARYRTPRTMATERLLATARTTGRGALRNWRHRTSTKPRRRTSGRAAAPSGDRLAIAAQDGERAAGRDRLGRVRGEELDGA